MWSCALTLRIQDSYLVELLLAVPACLITAVCPYVELNPLAYQSTLGYVVFYLSFQIYFSQSSFKAILKHIHIQATVSHVC